MFEKDKITETLDGVAQEMVLDEARGELRRRFSADKKKNNKKVKRGKNEGQKAGNTGLSKTKRKKKAKIALRTKKKKFGRAVSRKSLRKAKIANRKRKAAGQ